MVGNEDTTSSNTKENHWLEVLDDAYNCIIIEEGIQNCQGSWRRATNENTLFTIADPNTHGLFGNIGIETYRGNP